MIELFYFMAGGVVSLVFLAGAARVTAWRACRAARRRREMWSARSRQYPEGLDA